MGAVFLHLICPTVLLISMVYPMLRGWKKVHAVKSILLGWSFFLTGCTLQKLAFPWIGNLLTNGENLPQVSCLTNNLVFGVALGWLLPILFHVLGWNIRSSWEKRKARLI